VYGLSEKRTHEYGESSDFDETEPFGKCLTKCVPTGGHPGLRLGPSTMYRSQDSDGYPNRSYPANFDDETLSMISMDFDETEPVQGLTTYSIGMNERQGSAFRSVGPMSSPNIRRSEMSRGTGLSVENLMHQSVSGGHPGLGSVPGFGSRVSSYPTVVSNQLYGEQSGHVTNDGSEHGIVWSNSLRGEPSKHPDSGVTSGDYSASSSAFKNLDIDAISDGGFTDMGNYPGIRIASDKDSDSQSIDLASALRNLNPAEVERRRHRMGQNSSYDLEMESMGSPGAIAGCEEYFRSLPYGVDMPGRSIPDVNRTPSHRGSSFSYHTRRLPEKLRIVKPIEGSLTLHQWSRLATPHLGGVLEERVGVAMKGNQRANLDPLFDMYNLDDLEEDEEDFTVPSVRQLTKPLNTLTNSTVLHPETMLSTNSYQGTQMSSGMSSRISTRPNSRMSSHQGSMTDIPGMFSANDIGLSKLLNEKKISCARRSQLDLSAISSLTPSVLATPNMSRNLSPTGTPLHTPQESLPGSPDDKTNNGIVYSFFSSLKAAIYGQQRREHKNYRQKIRSHEKRKMLGIMEAVEEVGLDNILSDKEGTPMSIPDLSLIEKGTSQNNKRASSFELSDFDVRYLGVLDDFDELEDIKPGLLTLNQSTEPSRDPVEYTKEWIGQLSVPSLSFAGRPSLHRQELGRPPPLSDVHRHSQQKMDLGVQGHNMGGRGPGKIASPGEVKPPNQMSGMGVPRHPGTGAVMSSLGSQRNDLGTIPGLQVTDEGGGVSEEARSTGIPQSASFVGSITNIFFGRKGGYS